MPETTRDHAISTAPGAAAALDARIAHDRGTRRTAAQPTHEIYADADDTLPRDCGGVQRIGTAWQDDHGAWHAAATHPHLSDATAHGATFREVSDTIRIRTGCAPLPAWRSDPILPGVTRCRCCHELATLRWDRLNVRPGDRVSIRTYRCESHDPHEIDDRY